MTKKKFLEVGDVLYERSGYGNKLVRKITIDRTTKTMAISGTTKFRIDKTSFIKPIGNYNSFSRTTYELENEENKQEFKITLAIDYLENFKWKELNDTTLLSVLSLVKNCR